MRPAVRWAAGAAAGCLALSACGAGLQVPGFLHRQHLSRIVLTCDQAGSATASTGADNLNELLNMLHLGDIDTRSRQATPQPPGPACTARLFSGPTVSATVVIPYHANGTSLYLADTSARQRSGTYQLRQAIHIGDLRGFIKKYGP